MNNILYLKGSFEQKKSSSGFGGPELPKNSIITFKDLKVIKNDLERVKEFWINENLFSGALISVYYNRIIPKSKRIQEILKKGNETPNSTIVGARFAQGAKNQKHIITHFVSFELLDEAINKLEKCIQVLQKDFNGEMTTERVKALNLKKLDFKSTLISKNKFLKIIVDSYFIEKFDVFFDRNNLSKNSIVTLFKTNKKIEDLLEKIGIKISSTRVLDDTTILLSPDDLILLKNKAPYLISMAVSDLSELEQIDFKAANIKNNIVIPSPTNEPTIGVIDTLFDKNVYFEKWVEYHDLIKEEIPKETSDYNHGTAVSSIIVDGPSLNPALDDGCGRFKVRHFGVATGSSFSSFSIIKNIDEIVRKNRDIKVWNLSLGSKLEINKTFISPEAALLDTIQHENNVTFIIAGTNKSDDKIETMRIGAPADSINSLVVNSVSFSGIPASYSRKGPVLSFFTKPDVSYYGGDKDKKIKVFSANGEMLVAGTSFAAPWIARKMSYLIDILGLSREVAKALIIHSSTGWDKETISPDLIGYGVVPIKIEDIVNSKDDEIQFILYGTSQAYDTYNFRIPVPIFKEKHPFIAKATLCYFPACSRNQGVDYTNTEFEFSFGRINDTSIKPINNNYQSTDDGSYVREDEARSKFRKWDNIKHIREVSLRNIPKKVYENGNWGISVRTKERLDEKFGQDVNFGVIITLKEINGVNRIDDFIKNCYLRGWLVNKIQVENRIDIYNTAEEIIEFE